MSKNKQVNIKYSDSEENYDNIYQALCDYYEDLGTNNIEWSGSGFDECPGLTSELIEKVLYEEGESAFFKDIKMGGYFNSKYVTGGKLNFYYQPGKITCIGNGYSKSAEFGINAVRVKNNSLGNPTKTLVEIYVRKMVDVLMTMSLRTNAHKTPFMLETTADAVLSAKNLFKDIKASEPAIYKNKTRGGEDVSVNVLNTDVQYINNELFDEFNSYDAKILNILGIDNYVEDKMERVQSAEVEANEEVDEQSFSTRLEARQKACKELKRLFNLDFKVEYSNHKKAPEKKEEENEDGKLHD